MFEDFCYYTRWNAVANRRTYDAPADPWKTIRVDPGEVEHYAVVSLQWGLGRVEGGDWDRPGNCDRLADLVVHEGLTQRFEQDRDWTETAYLDWAADEIAERGRFRGCASVEAVIEEHCPAVDDLYEDIRTNGYRPNYEAVYDDPEDAEYVHDLEPMVMVGRTGEVVWTEGFHRLVLADLAGVAAVPVYVVVRHREWQAVRDALATTPPDERSAELTAFVDHPDVADVVG